MASSWWTDSTIHPLQCLLFPKKRWWKLVSGSRCLLPAPIWTPLWPWQLQLKALRGLTASVFHGGSLIQEAIMPGGWRMTSCQQNLNTLWSYDLVQKAGGVGSPAGTWLKRLGEIRGDSVLLCVSSTSITFSFSKSFHRPVAAIVLQTWCISIPITLTAVWDSHTAAPSPSSCQENEQLVWLREEAKCVQVGYPPC